MVVWLKNLNVGYSHLTVPIRRATSLLYIAVLRLRFVVFAGSDCSYLGAVISDTATMPLHVIMK